MPEDESDGRLISVALPAKYWIIVLSAMEYLVKKSAARIERMMDEGYDLEALHQLTPEQITALTGPLLARAMVVDALVADGLMGPQMAERAGTKAVWRMIERFRVHRPGSQDGAAATREE